MLDVTVGPVTSVIDSTTFQIIVTHIGKHNKFRYNTIETIYVIDNKTGYSVELLSGFTVRCHVNFRDTYNRLNAIVELSS